MPRTKTTSGQHHICNALDSFEHRCERVTYIRVMRVVPVNFCDKGPNKAINSSIVQSKSRSYMVNSYIITYVYSAE